MRTAMELSYRIDAQVEWAGTPSAWPVRSGVALRWQAVGEDEDLWMHDITPTWFRADGVSWAMLVIDRRGRVVQ